MRRPRTKISLNIPARSSTHRKDMIMGELLLFIGMMVFGALLLAFVLDR